MDTKAQEVLADLERLALAGLRHETETLEAAQRAVIAAASAERARCLDALELWQRAHDARVQAEEEAAVHASIGAGNAEEGCA